MTGMARGGMCDDRTLMRLRRCAFFGLVLLASGGPGCDYVQDRFRSCGHIAIDMINSDQSIDPVMILAEGEAPSADKLLVSGSSRRFVECVERGDVKRFRALRGDATLGIANCAVSRARYEYEATVGNSLVVKEPKELFRALAKTGAAGRPTQAMPPKATPAKKR